jgi:hypothetical protein
MFQANVIEKIKTQILCSVTFFPERLIVYEKMWKNTAERGRPQMTIRRKRIACWIPKATENTLMLCNTLCFPAKKLFHGSI